MDFDFNLIKLSHDGTSEKAVANRFRLFFASDTMNEDTEFNEDQQDVENLFDRLRSFVKVPEDVTIECFVEADKDISTTADVSGGGEGKELDGQNLDRAFLTSKEAIAGIKHNSLFVTNS
ncbi:hypothetical protein HZS_3943 [Henneguya salminicola]|nr:hypothetical protein HZS_3943 [Henneguya salminicola]